LDRFPISSSLPPPRLLIAERNPAVLEVLSPVLSQYIPGVAIDACLSLDEALPQLHRSDYDMVIMSDEGNRQHVIVTDIHMPFWSMVIFMVKWALASIPAIIILTLIAVFAWRILRGLDTKTVVVGSEVPSSATLHSKR